MLRKDWQLRFFSKYAVGKCRGGLGEVGNVDGELVGVVRGVLDKDSVRTNAF